MVTQNISVKRGQVYLRWLNGGPVTPFIVDEVGEKSFKHYQFRTENKLTMDIDMLEIYLESGDVRLVYDPEVG